MAVAKRQRREKPAKIEQRKVRRPEWEPQVKQTAPQASPVYIGQAPGEEKEQKKRGQNWTGGFSLHLLGRPAFMPRGCIFLCFLNKTTKTWNCNTGPSEEITRGCNTGPSVASNVCCDKAELRKLQTPPTKLIWFLLTHVYKDLESKLSQL